jgi:hypothetical protein
MAWAEPQDPRFFELALQHHYPLRHLSIAELLPVCRLDSYLAQVGCRAMHNSHDLPPIAQLQLRMTVVIRKRMSCECMHYDADKHMAIEAPCVCQQAPKSLTSLDDGLRMLDVWGPKEGGVASIAQVLQGICSLRSLSCSVSISESLCCLSTSCTSQLAVWQWHAEMACNVHLYAVHADPYAIAPSTAGLDECQAASLCSFRCLHCCLVQVDTTPDFPQPQLDSLDALNLMFVDLVKEQDYRVSSARITCVALPHCTVLC